MASIVGKNPKNQIQQMVSFILQEANEKVNEIRVKTDHDYNLEIQMLTRTGKLKVDAEYEQKERDREIQQRIEQSTRITRARVAKMEARQELIDELTADCIARVNEAPKQKGFKKTLKSLLVQGLVALVDETESQVCCRKEEQGMMQGLITEAVAEYKKKTGKDMTCTLNTTIVIPSNPMPGTPSGPGVVVIARDGGIVCDNTLNSRLTQAFEEQLPEIRRRLFPQNA